MLNTIDIILLVIILFGAYRGFKKGLLMELVAILALALGVLGSFYLLNIAIQTIKPYFKNWVEMLPYIAFIILFLAIILLIRWLGTLLKKSIDITFLGSFDRLGGAILGIVKWAFGISVVIWLCTAVGLEIPKDKSEETLIYPVIYELAPNVANQLGFLVPILKDLFESIKDTIHSN